MFTTADLPTALTPTAEHQCSRPDCAFVQAPVADPGPRVPSTT